MNLDENAHMREAYARDLVERACTYTGSRRACTHDAHTSRRARTRMHSAYLISTRLSIHVSYYT